MKAIDSSSPPPKKILFVGLAHSAGDSRLCHFLAKAIQSRHKNIECLYLGRDSIDPSKYSNRYLTVIEMPYGMNPVKRRFRPHDMEILAHHIEDKGVDLVQISDVRELMLGFALKKLTSIPVIFDSHEDYFNQKYEYSQKSIKGLLQGIICRTQEVLFTRYMDAVFCTDEYLEGLYRHPIFASKSVTMMRNIPPRNTIRKEPIVNQRDALKLVYIGSVNRNRGVIEAANHCERFNLEPDEIRQGVSLSFHVFSKPSPIIDELADKASFIYEGFIPQPQIAQAITQFDIGVSLLLRLKKFERNIPIKNFEYMAMGIPILTSNFGTMKRYVDEARAGVMIDPTDYSSFRDAILKLKNLDFRRECGERGIAYANKNFDRDVEVAGYLDLLGRLLEIH